MQWYEDKYKQENRYANYTLKNLKVWIKQKYDESKVHTPNNVGPKPRTHYWRKYCSLYSLLWVSISLGLVHGVYVF